MAASENDARYAANLQSGLESEAAMLAKACSCAVIGLDGALVEVEVDIGHGLPAFSIVGLPDAADTSRCIARSSLVCARVSRCASILRAAVHL
jgi:hypothetical protein